eukprot:COSAG06_NODE_57_length_27525_cov_14.855279_35_plen_64_part_00
MADWQCEGKAYVIISHGLAVVAPFAIIWFCDAKNVSHILPDYSNEVQMGLCKSTVHIANPCSA